MKIMPWIWVKHLWVSYRRNWCQHCLKIVRSQVLTRNREELQAFVSMITWMHLNIRRSIIAGITSTTRRRCHRRHRLHLHPIKVCHPFCLRQHSYKINPYIQAMNTILTFKTLILTNNKTKKNKFNPTNVWHKNNFVNSKF